MLIDVNRTGVLSTISTAASTSGFPLGSIVEYGLDAQGRPIFSLSSLSGHTRDIRADPRCSLTVTSPGFRGMSDARFTLIGRVQPISDAEEAAAREAYMSRNPGSFWVSFGDFAIFRMDEILEGRFNGGFARAATIPAAEFAAAQSDPVAGFSAPIATHMNEDHASSTRDMVAHYTGLPAESAEIIDLDRMGMNVIARYDGDDVPCRLPFPRPADDRKMVKTLIVEMTRAAAQASPQ
jgi:putative heme iron utilization protein